MNIASLLDEIKEQEVKKTLLDVVNWELAPLEYDETYMKEAILNLKKCLVTKRIEKLQDEMLNSSSPMQKLNITDTLIDEKKRLFDISKMLDELVKNRKGVM